MHVGDSRVSSNRSVVSSWSRDHLGSGTHTKEVSQLRLRRVYAYFCDHDPYQFSSTRYPSRLSARGHMIRDYYHGGNWTTPSSVVRRGIFWRVSARRWRVLTGLTVLQGFPVSSPLPSEPSTARGPRWKPIAMIEFRFLTLSDVPTGPRTRPQRGSCRYIGVAILLSIGTRTSLEVVWSFCNSAFSPGSR